MRGKTYIRKSWQDGTFLFLGLMYSLLLLRWGFAIGRGDHIEILPYALWLNDPSLYPRDLFLQSIVDIVPNERWTIAQMLALWGKQLETGIFVFHLLSSLLLLAGMDRLLRHLIQDKYLAWMTMGLVLIPFYLWNPGANELYGSTFTAASPAKALGMWALYCWLTRKNYLMVILLVFSSLIHPLVGLQLAMLIFGVEFLLNWKKLFSHKNTLLFPFLLYMLTGFLYILWIKISYGQTEATQPAKDFFEQIFAFRNGHHYMPSQYPLKTWFMAGLCWIMAYWQWKDKRIRLWLVLLLLGCIAYTIGVEVLRNPTVAAFQWFKVSVWLKVLGIGAMAKMVGESVGERLRMGVVMRFEKQLLFLALTAALAVLFFATSYLPWKVPFDFGRQKQADSLIAICLEAKEKTPKDALFIHPMEIAAFSYYAERAVYISYKANLKQNAGAKIWSDRVKEIYGLDFRKSYLNKEASAREAFMALDEPALQALRTHHISHILSYRSHLLPAEWLLVHNQDWAIYEIPPINFE